MEFQLLSIKHTEKDLLSDLLKTWKEFVSELPRNFSPENAIGSLEEFSQANLNRFKEKSSPLIKNSSFRSTNFVEDGMNSPGILWDRLTILNCKYLFTASDSAHYNPAFHKDLGNVQIELESVTKALSEALPARNILLAKEATNRQHEIVPLEDSLWMLQTSNIAMWINQDLLYTVSADDVNPERLRDYIKFFSKANRIRNTAIENIEIFYSNKMKGKL